MLHLRCTPKNRVRMGNKAMPPATPLQRFLPHIAGRKVMQNIKELMKRYNISRQGIMSFVDRHLDKINADGEEHAKQTVDGWQFDEIAVQKIDKLRGLSEVAIIESGETGQIAELKEEVENLKSLLLMTQNKLLQKQEELLSAERKYLLTESASKVEEVRRENLEEKLASAEIQMNTMQKKLEKAEQQIEQLRRRGLVDRILNNL